MRKGVRDASGNEKSIHTVRPRMRKECIRAMRPRKGKGIHKARVRCVKKQGKTFAPCLIVKQKPLPAVRCGQRSCLCKEKSRHLPIFPGRLQPSIFGTTKLNFCVRNGNRWILGVIGTGCESAVSISALAYSLCF